MPLLSRLKRILWQLKLRELSTMQKLYVAMILISCCLVFYAVGIITNFFASPVFSMFFVISYDTAHNIVSYVAIALAVSLSIAALAISLVKRRKSVLLLEPEYEPVIDVVDAPGEALVQATSPVDDQKIAGNSKGQGAEQEEELNKQPATQQIDPSTTQAPAELTTDKNTTTNQEAVLTLNKDKITCPACKKEFSIPVFMPRLYWTKAKAG